MIWKYTSHQAFVLLSTSPLYASRPPPSPIPGTPIKIYALLERNFGDPNTARLAPQRYIASGKVPKSLLDCGSSYERMTTTLLFPRTLSAEAIAVALAVLAYTSYVVTDSRTPVARPMISTT